VRDNGGILWCARAGQRKRPLDDKWTFGSPSKNDARIQLASAVQRNWQVPAEFPLCPATNSPTPIATYLGQLQEGAFAVISPLGKMRVEAVALSSDGNDIFILGEHGEDAIKPWSLSQITFEEGLFVHESQRTFFMRDSAEKEYTLTQRLAWEGGETFDDYC
jgi:hypothetical protein